MRVASMEQDLFLGIDNDLDSGLYLPGTVWCKGLHTGLGNVIESLPIFNQGTLVMGVFRLVVHKAKFLNGVDSSAVFVN